MACVECPPTGVHADVSEESHDFCNLFSNVTAPGMRAHTRVSGGWPSLRGVDLLLTGSQVLLVPEADHCLFVVFFSLYRSLFS